tara:strand:- start:100 stop:945 length:846 start_codon:yes stop_codon:yes gene_type:complete
MNTYILSRLKRTYKLKGFKGVASTLFNYLVRKINPKHVGELPFKYLFLKKRRYIKKFNEKYLDKLDDKNIIPFGGYLLKSDFINANSIVYTFGVGTSLHFEEKLSEKYQCGVWCYDPTDCAVEFMKDKDYDKKLINYFQYGIWINDEKVKFYIQDIGAKNSGGSITNLFENSEFKLLQCNKLSTFMKKNNHNKIDILKMDIEGAAIDVLNNILDEKIFPTQIVVEFESSETTEFDEEKFNIWKNKVANLILKFRANNYKCYNLPRYSHQPYSTTEVLFVKK